MKDEERIRELPTTEELEMEVDRLQYKKRYQNILRSTALTLVVVAAIAVLMATLLIPFLRIYGTSMTPTLENGDIIACVKTTDFDTGEIMAFYYNNKILVKRVIGHAGDMIDIKDDGTVYVNGSELDEPYVREKALGECNIQFPYQVPESAVFVMGDHRKTSVDSRSTSVGCVSEDQMVGKVLLRIWPLNHFGIVH